MCYAMSGGNAIHSCLQFLPCRLQRCCMTMTSCARAALHNTCPRLADHADRNSQHVCTMSFGSGTKVPAVHHETLWYYQSTSRVRGSKLQNLTVVWLAGGRGTSLAEGRLPSSHGGFCEGPGFQLGCSPGRDLPPLL